jgi:hypothetical protein
VNCLVHVCKLLSRRGPKFWQSIPNQRGFSTLFRPEMGMTPCGGHVRAKRRTACMRARWGGRISDAPTPEPSPLKETSRLLGSLRAILSSGSRSLTPISRRRITCEALAWLVWEGKANALVCNGLVSLPRTSMFRSQDRERSNRGAPIRISEASPGTSRLPPRFIIRCR